MLVPSIRVPSRATPARRSLVRLLPLVGGNLQESTCSSRQFTRSRSDHVTPSRYRHRRCYQAPPRRGARDRIRKSARSPPRAASPFTDLPTRAGELIRVCRSRPKNPVSVTGILVSCRRHRRRRRRERNSTETNHPGSQHGGRSP